ncbi:MAG: beta-ketoacyl-ACP reductase [Alphaproteobacteria bacterium]|nr:beta-ketoacyl-ACP reductase [Alphaproteobacteria bacterium]
MPLLADRKMLVTGGSRGIGAGIVRAALQEGAEVAFVFQHNRDLADELVSEMAARYPGQRCLAFQCDITDTDKTRELAKSVIAAFGRLDVLVNNAGITRDAALGRMRREQWDAVMETNLGGLFNVTQPLLMQFVRQRAGSIINMTSYAGVSGSKSQANYSASKGGIIAFTKSLSKEVAEHGVRVNAVAPGFIETEMVAMLTEDRLTFLKSQIPIGRFGTSEDVANLVCFLASDLSSYITGQVIQIDGGLVL